MPFKPPITGQWGKPLLPMRVGLNVEAGDTGADYGDGVLLAQAYAGAVDQFVAAQRRNAAAGIVQIVSGRTQLDGLDVFYKSQFGHEMLSMTAYPGGRPPPEEALPSFETPTINPDDLIAVEFKDGTD